MDKEQFKSQIITAIAVILVALMVGLGARYYLDWYFSIPVVKMTPDGQVVAVEVRGQYHGPDYLEKMGVEKYKKHWVSFDWKPE